jgi:hypothetical protein
VLQVLLIVGRQLMPVLLASRPLILLILTAGRTHARRMDRTAVRLLSVLSFCRKSSASAAIGNRRQLGIG